MGTLASESTTLCGEQAGNRTLDARAGHFYILACRYTVPAGATLTIEPGVTI